MIDQLKEGAPWDVPLMSPNGLGYEDWLAWHWRCFIKDPDPKEEHAAQPVQADVGAATPIQPS